jgi:hypothetical protein
VNHKRAAVVERDRADLAVGPARVEGDALIGDVAEFADRCASARPARDRAPDLDERRVVIQSTYPGVFPAGLPGFNQWLGFVADSRNRAQIRPTGWVADTLAASNFVQLFICASFVPKSPASLNLFEYCNPRLDANVKHAVALEVSDPERANEAWATVDRALVDQAVAVPWTNGRNPVLLSDRVGNYQNHPLWGTLFDQLWVK